MNLKQKFPDGKPSILDRPSFNAATEALTDRSCTARGSDTNPEHDKILRQQPVDYDSATKKTTPPSFKQPYRTVRPKPNKPYPKNSPDTFDLLRTSSRRHHSSITITLPRSPRGSRPAPVNLPVPVSSNSPSSSHSDDLCSLSKHRPNARPLPPSKIHFLKQTYETLNPDIPIDHYKQIRLSRALSLHGRAQKALEQLATFSQLPFVDVEDISTAGVLMSCVDGRAARDARLGEVEERREMVRATARMKYRLEYDGRQQKAGMPYIVRCGEMGSGSPILVGRMGKPGDKDRYELYFERDVMPREVRFLVLQVWGMPFGYEGRDWDVDLEGRLWVRERPHRDNPSGRWWKVQG